MYSFTYRNSAADFFKFRMSGIYHQWTVVVNFVFTFAFACLIYARWDTTNVFGKILMLAGLLAFPVIQPLAVFIASAGEAKKIPVDTTLTFDEKGMGIQVQKHHQLIFWRDFYNAKIHHGYLLVIPDGLHAYLIPDRVLEGKKQALYEMIRDNAGHWGEEKG